MENKMKEDLREEMELQEERLLNAFQLVKNGVKMSGLMFSEFKRVMEFKRGHDGKLVKKTK